MFNQGTQYLQLEKGKETNDDNNNFLHPIDRRKIYLTDNKLWGNAYNSISKHTDKNFYELLPMPWS